MEHQREEEKRAWEAGYQVVKVARRVYVGNLAWKTSWQDLKDHFSSVGPVKYADILREGGSGSRSKGCGIVEYETAEAAAAAIQCLNHTNLDGRQIFVREDREDFELKGEVDPQSDPNLRMHKRPRGSGVQTPITLGRRVWVGNLNFETTWQELKDHFKAAGHVSHADIIVNPDGQSKGCGIVEFESPSDALRAISLLSNSKLDDRLIIVREDREDPVTLTSTRMGPRTAASGSAVAADGTQIVVHGLPYRMAWQELKDLARSCSKGPVIRADIITNPDGSSKGYGVLAFSNQADAQAAILQLNGQVIDGRVLTAKFDKFAPQ